MAVSYADARRNANKIADSIFDMKLKSEALDDGKYWIFPWDEDTTENPLAVHKEMGWIILYDPEAHPEFQNAAIV